MPSSARFSIKALGLKNRGTSINPIAYSIPNVQRYFMIAYAHSLPETDDEALWESLSIHLMEVAALCAQFATAFGMVGLARLAGLLHDIGKNSVEYQLYIRGKAPSPDHSTAGAVEAVRGYGMAGKMLAFAIAGHHAGLADGSGYGGTNRPAEGSPGCRIRLAALCGLERIGRTMAGPGRIAANPADAPQHQRSWV
ncbi:MAG: CRISPR-associated endonuclease Cas3'' [Acetobacteraceae bacterium]